MRNLKKRAFSIFGVNLPEKGSFQRLSRHSDYRILGARGILTLRETLSRGDAGGGRSMVEMLGVLAVIGVLSIGGIVGYRTAMDYYQANEIIDSVGKAATQLSVGLVSGTIPSASTNNLKLDKTTTTNDHDIVAYIDQSGTFGIQVQGLTQSVCENILNRDWELPLEIKAGCSDNTNIDFLFANDLSDEATVTVPLPEGQKNCQSDADCENGAHCGYTGCIADEEYCEYLYFQENGCQSKNPDKPHCLANRCVAGCTSDDDCKGTGNPYCLTFTDYNSGNSRSMCVECMENAHCAAGSFCSGSFESCTESSYNTCKKEKVASSYTASDGKTYDLSTAYMSWWDADNFCKSLGKSLVPAVELNRQGVDGSENYDWDGAYKTALVGELYTGFGSPIDSYVWTATDYGTSSTSSSKTCVAYLVYLLSGGLYHNNRYRYYRTLCR